MRVRRPAIAKWIHATNRAYLYAGPVKGATVAAWKQAARAELAITQRGISFGQVLLDLVKATTMCLTTCWSRKLLHWGTRYGSCASPLRHTVLPG